MVSHLKTGPFPAPAHLGRGVAQPGQRTCFGSRGSEVQILSPRPIFPEHPSVRNAILALALVLCALAAAASAASPKPCIYTVRSGDYLGRIAAKTGTTITEIKSANKLKSDLIRPGQKLKINRPFHRTRARSIKWRRPFRAPKGEILRKYGNHKNGRVTLPRTGTDIRMPVGTILVSPANGVLRYAGDQAEYGYLLIIEHGAGFATVLGPFDPESVTLPLNSFVGRNQVLGKTAAPPYGNQPYAHIELRLNNEATNPRRLLK